MKRVLTAAVLIPVVLAIIFLTPVPVFALFVAAVALLAAREYLGLLKSYGMEPLFTATYAVLGVVFLIAVLAGMTGLGFLPRSALVFFLPVLAIGSFVVFALAMRRPDLRTAFPSAALSMVAVLYVGLPLLLIVEMVLRAKFDTRGRMTVLILLLFVWIGDTAAYYAGRAFGRHKMAPRISPGKTWEGAVASVLGAAAVGVLAWQLLPRYGWGDDTTLANWIVLAIVVNVAAQAGDLVESMIKRGAGVKDSGSLLPGHGGMLDRIDALLFAAPAMWYYPEIRDLLILFHIR